MRCFIFLLSLLVLLTGCTTRTNVPAVVQTSMAIYVQPSPEPIDETRYRATDGSVSICSNGVYAHPLVNWLSSATLQPDGGLLCADGAGLLPNSGGVTCDATFEKPKQLLQENQPLHHTGSVQIALTAIGGYRATYSIYDSNCRQLEEYGYQNALPKDGILSLPQRPGLYFVSLSVSWSAPQQYPGAPGRESVCYEYVFLVEYETVGPT